MSAVVYDLAAIDDPDGGTNAWAKNISICFFKRNVLPPDLDLKEPIPFHQLGMADVWREHSRPLESQKKVGPANCVVRASFEWKSAGSASSSLTRILGQPAVQTN